MIEDYDASEHRKTMYAHFGAAFYLVNCFEHGLANALLLADFLNAQKDAIKLKRESFDRQKFETQFDAFFDNQTAQTMGNLLRRLQKVFSVTEGLTQKMLKVKERRDFLAHHFFRERAEDILTRSGLDGMIAELERDQSLFKAVDQELERAIAPKRLEFGIKEEFLEKYFEEFLKQIRRNETSDN